MSGLLQGGNLSRQRFGGREMNNRTSIFEGLKFPIAVLLMVVLWTGSFGDTVGRVFSVFVSIWLLKNLIGLALLSSKRVLEIFRS